MYIRDSIDNPRHTNERRINSDILANVRKNDRIDLSRAIDQIDGFSFRLSSAYEDPSVIMEQCQPEGKDVLAVCGFGYPFHFLAYGAKSVIGVDNSGEHILWNRFLRDSISISSGAEMIEMFENFKSHEMLKHELKDEFGQDYYDDLLEKLRSSLQSCYRDMVENDYSFVFDPEQFEKTQNRILEGSLILQYYDLLKSLRSLDSESLDVIYASSVRSFVKTKYGGHGFETDNDFENYYDKQLARETSRVLRKNGIFYEAVINTADFDNSPITQYGYWKLIKHSEKKRPQSYRPEAMYLDLYHEWVIGTKE